jgi:hypothetical protein
MPDVQGGQRTPGDEVAPACERSRADEPEPGPVPEADHAEELRGARARITDELAPEQVWLDRSYPVEYSR